MTQFLHLQYGGTKNTLRWVLENVKWASTHKAMQRKPHLVHGTRVSKWVWERRLESRKCEFSLWARNLAASLESDFFSLPTYKPLPSSTASSLKYLLPGSPFQLPDCSALAVYNTDKRFSRTVTLPPWRRNLANPCRIAHTQVCIFCFLLTFSARSSDLHSP